MYISNIKKLTGVKMKKFKFAVVLGKNWREYPPKNAPKDWCLCMSIEGKMTTLAAGEFYRHGCAEKIIFSGGKTAGKDFESEAEAMRGYLHIKFPEIPNESILLEERSFNTQGNAENVAQMLGKEKDGLALITMTSHLPRAVKIFAQHSLSVQGFKSEELLREYSLRRRRFVAKFLASRRAKFENFKEGILRAILLVDPKGEFIGRISRKIRHENS